MVSFHEWLTDWCSINPRKQDQLHRSLISICFHFLQLQWRATTPCRRSKWRGSTVLTRASTRTLSFSGPSSSPSSTTPSASGWRAQPSRDTQEFAPDLLVVSHVFNLLLDLKMPLTAAFVHQFIWMKGVYAQDGGSRSQSLHRAQARGNGKISLRVSSDDIFIASILFVVAFVSSKEFLWCFRKSMG